MLSNDGSPSPLCKQILQNTGSVGHTEDARSQNLKTCETSGFGWGLTLDNHTIFNTLLFLPVVGSTVAWLGEKEDELRSSV
jgi:hypothetical protein